MTKIKLIFFFLYFVNSSFSQVKQVISPIYNYSEALIKNKVEKEVHYLHKISSRKGKQIIKIREEFYNEGGSTAEVIYFNTKDSSKIIYKIALFYDSSEVAYSEETFEDGRTFVTGYVNGDKYNGGGFDVSCIHCMKLENGLMDTVVFCDKMEKFNKKKCRGRVKKLYLKFSYSYRRE